LLLAKSLERAIFVFAGVPTSLAWIGMRRTGQKVAKEEEEAVMAIQQYDYMACCTGFLQQLPSFWGISSGNGRSFCPSTGRKERGGQRSGEGGRRGPQ